MDPPWIGLNEQKLNTNTQGKKIKADYRCIVKVYDNTRNKTKNHISPNR